VKFARFSGRVDATEAGSDRVSNKSVRAENVVVKNKPKKEVSTMNWDQVSGQWKQLKGKVKEKWGDLTDDDLDKVSGKRDQLVGTIQQRYGIAKDEAERRVDQWANELDQR